MEGGPKSLEAVLSIARRGSFRAAARDIAMSTTALSHTIGQLVDIVTEGFDLSIRTADLVPRAMIALPLGTTPRPNGLRPIGRRALLPI